MMFIACESSVLVYIVAYILYNVYIMSMLSYFVTLQWILRKHIRMSSKEK